jgi:calcineurin-like phosphoesterase family protein
MGEAASPATVWFTADTHFGHGGALGLFRRPFDSVAAMDEALIGRWNAVVREGDEVWHLGDVAVRQRLERVVAVLARLVGRKHLIAGNNDTPEIRALPGWASVADYRELSLGGRQLVLCHYPLRSWNGMARGAINLHGHSHGRLAPLPRQVDVGVDAWAFAPIGLDAILARPRRRAVRT